MGSVILMQFKYVSLNYPEHYAYHGLFLHVQGGGGGRCSYNMTRSFLPYLIMHILVYPQHTPQLPSPEK
jgi:hypothetical protein